LTGEHKNAFCCRQYQESPLPHAPADALWVRVYYEDTDFSGRVYHASYLRFLERGRTEWLRRRGFTNLELAKSIGIAFAVRSLQIEYLAPAMMDDLLIVETSAAAVRGASITFNQRVVRDDKALVTASVLAASIRDDRPARIPAELRRLFQPPA
jgi:acyl-CoA thioester hydrolase